MSPGPTPPTADPVFVDSSGRRRRLLRRMGIMAGCLLAAYLVFLTFGLVSGTRVPLTPWPAVKRTPSGAEPGHGGPAPTRSATAGTSPNPAPRTRRASTRPAAPSSGAAAPSSTAPRPGATTTHPGKGRAYGRTKSPNPRRP